MVYKFRPNIQQSVLNTLPIAVTSVIKSDNTCIKIELFIMSCYSRLVDCQIIKLPALYSDIQRSNPKGNNLNH